MFESFENRKRSRAGAIAPIVVAIAAVVVVWVVLSRRGEEREHERERDEMALLAGAPDAGADAGAGAEPAASAAGLARLELPGMSLETPTRAPITGDYVTGGAQHMTPPEWTVTWQAGDVPPREALDRLVGTMSQALEGQQGSPARITGSRELDVGGAPGRQYELVNERGYRIALTFARCGGRVVQILVGGAFDVQRTSAAMTSSFRCTPDPAQTSDREAVAVAARPGWRRTKPTGTPTLVDDHEVLVRPSLLPPSGGVPLEAVVPLATRGGGFQLDADRPRTLPGGRKLWRGSVDSHPAAIVAWTCPGEQRIAVVYVISTQDAPLDAGIDLALTGRCLAPGEAPPTYPVKARKAK